MKLDEVVHDTLDAITIRRVFGEPFERDGTTIIPAANIMGGGGGGSGHDESGQEGEGGGFGIGGRPAGAYVIRDGKVSWQPAVDVNKLFQTIGMVLIAWMFTRVRMTKIRAKAARD